MEKKKCIKATYDLTSQYVEPYPLYDEPPTVILKIKNRYMQAPAKLFRDLKASGASIDEMEMHFQSWMDEIIVARKKANQRLRDWQRANSLYVNGRLVTTAVVVSRETYIRDVPKELKTLPKDEAGRIQWKNDFNRFASKDMQDRFKYILDRNNEGTTAIHPLVEYVQS